MEQLKWSEIEADPDYQSLDEEGKAEIKQSFYNKVIMADPDYKTLSPEGQQQLRNSFFGTVTMPKATEEPAPMPEHKVPEALTEVLKYTFGGNTLAMTGEKRIGNYRELDPQEQDLVKSVFEDKEKRRSLPRTYQEELTRLYDKYHRTPTQKALRGLAEGVATAIPYTDLIPQARDLKEEEALRRGETSAVYNALATAGDVPAKMLIAGQLFKAFGPIAEKGIRAATQRSPLLLKGLQYISNSGKYGPVMTDVIFKSLSGGATAGGVFTVTGAAEGIANGLEGEELLKHTAKDAALGITLGMVLGGGSRVIKEAAWRYTVNKTLQKQGFPPGYSKYVMDEVNDLRKVFYNRQFQWMRDTLSRKARAASAAGRSYPSTPQDVNEIKALLAKPVSEIVPGGELAKHIETSTAMQRVPDAIELSKGTQLALRLETPDTLQKDLFPEQAESIPVKRTLQGLAKFAKTHNLDASDAETLELVKPKWLSAVANALRTGKPDIGTMSKADFLKYAKVHKLDINDPDVLAMLEDTHREAVSEALHKGDPEAFAANPPVHYLPASMPRPAEYVTGELPLNYQLSPMDKIGQRELPLGYTPVPDTSAPKDAEAAEPVTPIDNLSSARQHVMAIISKRLPGLLKNKEARKAFFKETIGKENLKDMSSEELALLGNQITKGDAVKKFAKKRKIKNPITEETANRLENIKAGMALRGELSPELYQEALSHTRYADEGLLSEPDAKALVTRLINYALPGRIMKADQALRTSGSELGSIYNKIATKAESPKYARLPTAFDSMRYVMEQMGKLTGKPFRQMYDMAIHARRLQENAAYEGLKNITQLYKQTEQTQESQNRVSQYISSQLKSKTAPPKPQNITPAEKKLAEALQAFSEGYKDYVKYIRFMDYYFRGKEIPDASEEALEEAIKIFESKGEAALKEHLKGVGWGVIETGFEPLEMLRKPLSFPSKRSPLALGKGHTYKREGVAYVPPETNIIERYARYAKQIGDNYATKPYLQSIWQIMEDNIERFTEDQQKKIESMFKVWTEAMLSRDVGHTPAETFMAKFTRLATLSKVAINLRGAIRNRFQNLSFFTDKKRLLKQHALPENVRERFEVEVAENKHMQEFFFLDQVKHIPLIGPLADIAEKIPVYMLADHRNRLEAFRAVYNTLTDIWKNRELSLEGKLNKANLDDLTLEEQKIALQKLATQGEEEFKFYVAQTITGNVHFYYDRAQKSPAEMGPVGRTIGNLFTFKRATTERIARAAYQTVHGHSRKAQWRGLKILMGHMWGGIVANYLYAILTGRDDRPYSPLSLVAWTPGGLTTGALEELYGLCADMVGAATGDRKALGRVPGRLVGISSMFIPFYDYFIQSIEAMTGTENIDKAMLKELKAIIAKEKKNRHIDIKTERGFLQAMQHALVGIAQNNESMWLWNTDRLVKYIKNNTTSTGLPHAGMEESVGKAKAELKRRRR